MTGLIELGSNYSTRRNMTIEKPAIEKKVGDKFESSLFLPEGKGRQGEGGLRTQGYFKANLEVKVLITIVTVVNNGEQFLEETILSVINQTYDNIEYIIIDGGSTDATLGIIRKYEHAIDYWVSEKDSGIYDAMNKGIDLATGEWINFMNGGDCFFTEMVLNEVFFNDYSEETDILYGNHQVRYSSGRKRDVQAGNIKNLWKGSQFCHQASFTRANYHKLFKFNLCTKIVADFEFFYDAWKNQASFKAIPLTVASFEAGGVSDIKRIDSILGWWQIVDKSFIVNKYYIFVLVKELLKEIIKKKAF